MIVGASPEWYVWLLMVETPRPGEHGLRGRSPAMWERSASVRKLERMAFLGIRPSIIGIKKSGFLPGYIYIHTYILIYLSNVYVHMDIYIYTYTYIYILCNRHTGSPPILHKFKPMALLSLPVSKRSRTLFMAANAWLSTVTWPPRAYPSPQLVPMNG